MKYLWFVAVLVFLLSCADDTRDNPYDRRAINYIGNTTEGSSSSVGTGDEPSSSSGNEEPSSGSVVPSSSSVSPSSSSVALSSSSSNVGCAGFVNGTKRSHYGIDKEQFCDVRDGKKYVYVKIGEQTWMAENLNYDASDSKCYDNSEANCETYGKLYNWATAMNNSASSTANPSGVRGICPTGWHLPSATEWGVLGNDTKKLKATSGWNNNGNGTDDYGFSALPGGGGSDGSFYHVGNRGLWWSASEYLSYGVSTRLMHGSADYADWNLEGKTSLFSVRCVQD
jgi:uncharacterized protein (TIGR02145 family)